jgi:hypothetical protein
MKSLYRLFFLTVITLSFVYPHNSMIMAQDHVKIFSLQEPNQAPHHELPELNNPFISGISWRFRWKTIQPRDNEYSWELIDRAIEVSGKAGRKAMLRVIAGISTPEWLYQMDIKSFEFSNTDLANPKTYKDRLRMPIPWDEVYLTQWQEFIQAFGQRYNGNPHIYSIQMTGGGHIGEMNLPKAHKKWQQVGYSDAKLIAAWQRIIDAYQKAFPDTPTNLDINEPLGRRSNVLNPVVSYVLVTYPGKVYLQQNGLKADFAQENRIRQIIREASAKTTVGYQMVGGKDHLHERTGDRIAAFRNALEDRVGYVEVYAADVRDPAQQRALQFLATRSEENRP